MVNKKIAKYLVIIFSIASGIVGLIQLLLGFLGGVQGFLIAGIVLVCFAVALPLFVFVALNPIIKLCVKIGQLNGGRILFFGGMLLVIFSVRFIIKTIIEWASENSGYGSFLWDTFEGWGAGGMTWLAFGGMLLSGVILAFSIMLLRKVKNQESGLSPFDKVLYIAGICAFSICALTIAGVMLAIFIALVVGVIAIWLLMSFAGTGGGSRVYRTPSQSSGGGGYIQKNEYGNYDMYQGNEVSGYTKTSLKDYNPHTGEASDYKGNDYKID